VLIAALRLTNHLEITKLKLNRLFKFAILAYILLFLSIGFSCRREAPDLMSELPRGSTGTNGNSYDGRSNGTPAEELAFNAVSTGDMETLKKEISLGNVSIFSKSPSTGRTLLETAVMSGSLEIVDYLIALDQNIIYGELIQISNNSGLIDQATRRALIEKITTGEQSQQALDLALMTLVENGMDDELELADFNALQNLLFEKGADATLTEFYNIPVHSAGSGAMRRLGVNLLYKALGCKEYIIEWIIDEQNGGEVEVELDYFDIDCSGIRKPNFIKLLIDAGADFTQKVVFFDEPTTFSQLLEELSSDFSTSELDSISKAMNRKHAPLYKALGCKDHKIADTMVCDLDEVQELNQDNVAMISDLLAKGADPYFQTSIKVRASLKSVDFFQILNVLKSKGKISAPDFNNLISTTQIYK
jgi:hypothetical protein